MRSMLLVFGLMITTPILSYGVAFEAHNPGKTTQFGNYTITEGQVNLLPTLELKDDDGKKTYFHFGTHQKTFNQALSYCEALGEEWRLPSGIEAYFTLFLRLFPTYGYELDTLGSKAYPFWFVDPQPPHSLEALKGSDVMMMFADGGSSSGATELVSLYGVIEALTLPPETTLKDVLASPHLAAKILLKAKLEEAGVPVICASGSRLSY